MRSFSIFAAIRRASSFLTLIKVLIDPLWFQSRMSALMEPLGGGNEAFAVHLGSFRGSASKNPLRRTGVPITIWGAVPAIAVSRHTTNA